MVRKIEKVKIELLIKEISQIIKDSGITERDLPFNQHYSTLYQMLKDLTRIKSELEMTEYLS